MQNAPSPARPQNGAVLLVAAIGAQLLVLGVKLMRLAFGPVHDTAVGVVPPLLDRSAAVYGYLCVVGGGVVVIIAWGVLPRTALLISAAVAAGLSLYSLMTLPEKAVAAIGVALAVIALVAVVQNQKRPVV